MPFSERYGHRRKYRASMVRESTPELVNEHLVQCIWYDRLFRQSGMTTSDGRTLKIISPGWWNHGEGPDFKGAQIEFDGRARTGDVEIHLKSAGWHQHGHDLDQRYDEVMLHATLDHVGGGADIEVASLLHAAETGEPCYRLHADTRGWVVESAGEKFHFDRGVGDAELTIDGSRLKASGPAERAALLSPVWELGLSAPVSVWADSEDGVRLAFGSDRE